MTLTECVMFVASSVRSRAIRASGYRSHAFPPLDVNLGAGRMVSMNLGACGSVPVEEGRVSEPGGRQVVPQVTGPLPKRA